MKGMSGLRITVEVYAPSDCNALLLMEGEELLERRLGSQTGL
jgi:hypothetical protein